MNVIATEQYLLLKSERSELLAEYKEQLRNGCDCSNVQRRLEELEADILYFEFNEQEYVPTIKPSELQIITDVNKVNPYVFKSSNYLLEDFVETIECQGSGNFTIILTSVIGQENRVVNIINSSESFVSISAVAGEFIGNNGDSVQTRQIAVGDSVTLKSNGKFTWRIS